MSVSDNLCPTHSEKALNAMKAPRSVKRITFNPSEANPGETLPVRVPKLNENEVLVPGSLQQLSCPERIAGACEEDCNKVWGRDLRRHGGL